jgi:hypothetical protein
VSINLGLNSAERFGLEHDLSKDWREPVWQDSMQLLRLRLERFGQAIRLRPLQVIRKSALAAIQQSYSHFRGTKGLCCQPCVAIRYVLSEYAFAVEPDLYDLLQAAEIFVGESGAKSRRCFVESPNVSFANRRRQSRPFVGPTGNGDKHGCTPRREELRVAYHGRSVF